MSGRGYVRGKKYTFIYRFLISLFILSLINISISHNAQAIENSVSHLLIYEVSPYPYPKTNMEYVCIINPTNSKINLSGYQITDFEGYLNLSGEISPMGKLYIAQNSSTFYSVMGFYPNYTYDALRINGSFNLAASGDEVILRHSGSVVDAVIYGKSHYEGIGWIGNPLKITQGHILRRISFVDTDTSKDWSNYHKIGQSNFKMEKFKSSIEIFTYPDDRDEVYRFLKEAKKSIMIESYTMDDEKFGNLLIKKLDEGVNVSILLEGNPVGGIKDDEKYIIQEIYLHGGKIYFMVNLGKFKNRYSFVHSKFIIRDEKNVLISTENFDFKSMGICGNRGYGIIVRDEKFARYMVRIFNDDRRNAGDIEKYDGDYGNITPYFNKVIELRAKIFKPINITTDIEPVIAPDYAISSFTHFVSSQKYMDVEALYLKDYPLRMIYGKARRILVENPTKNYTMRKFNGENIHIRELHAKLLIGDSSAFVGSVNFGNSSLLRNREVSLIIHGKNAVEYFEKVFEYDWNDRGEIIAFMHVKLHGNHIKIDLAKSIGEIKKYEVYIDGKLVYNGKNPSYDGTIQDGTHRIVAMVFDGYGDYDQATTEVNVENNLSLSPEILIYLLIFSVFTYKIIQRKKSV